MFIILPLLLLGLCQADMAHPAPPAPPAPPGNSQGAQGEGEGAPPEITGIGIVQPTDEEDDEPVVPDNLGFPE